MPKIYRGTSAEWVNQYLAKTNPKSFDPTGGGEFGAGCYFWLEDKYAAFMSAVQYNAGERDWGVLMIEFSKTNIQALARREAGYGSRVLEFPHNGPRMFEEMGTQGPGSFVVPKDYSHLAVEKGQQATHTPKKTGLPPARSFGHMQSEDFRKINADPDKYGIDGKKNELVWQYDLIIGLCAADYSDTKLVQMKFSNHGMTFLNNMVQCVRTKVITGKKITKNWQTASGWKMADREKLWKLYVEGKTEPIDIDKQISK